MDRKPFASTFEDRSEVARCVERVESRIPELSQRFYAHLFSREPAATAVFQGGAPFRQRKFANLLATFRQVAYLERMRGTIHRLGERHGDFHRQFRRFLDPMRDSLFAAMRETLEDEWTPGLEWSWSATWTDVADLMGGDAQHGEVERRAGGPWIGRERRTSWRPRGDESLLDEIGGPHVVLAVHRTFYDAVFEDGWIGRFFGGKDRSVLAEKQTAFMVSAFGGEHDYRGSTPAIVHMHMYITAEVADVREQYLRWAILEHGLGEAIADRWIAVDRIYRPAVVKHDVAQCDLVCMGQMAIQAARPAGYKWAAPRRQATEGTDGPTAPGRLVKE